MGYLLLQFQIYKFDKKYTFFDSSNIFAMKIII